MEMEIKPLTHFVKPDKLGKYKGKCIFCYQFTEHGFSIDEIPNTFTDWDKVLTSSSNVVCEYCFNFLKNENFRRRNWIIYNNQVHFLRSKKEVLRFIEYPPNPPFAIYVIKQGKKHGWIQMMYKGVNYSKEVITVGFEDELITFNRLEFLELIKLLQEARKKGVKKDELRTLNINVIRKVGFELFERLRSWREWNEGLFELGLTIID